MYVTIDPLNRRLGVVTIPLAGSISIGHESVRYMYVMYSTDQVQCLLETVILYPVVLVTVMLLLRKLWLIVTVQV